MQSWFALWTKAGKEQWAAANLRNQGIVTLAPEYQVRKPDGKGKTKLVPRPLFPRYIFAKFDLGSSTRRVRNTRGVCGIVSFADEPVMVDEFVIAEIQSRIAEDGFVLMDDAVSDIECPYRAGERVMITVGAATGIDGIFQERIKGEDRALILMDFLGRQTVVPVALEAIGQIEMAGSY